MMDLPRRSRRAIVFESISAVPYFTPLFARGPVLSMVHHVIPRSVIVQKVGLLGLLVEGIQNWVTPWLYRTRSVITNVGSAQAELRSLGYSNVHAVRTGVDVPLSGTFPLDQKVDLVVVAGPLRPWKRIEHCLEAFSALPERWSLCVFGAFENDAYRDRIVDLAQRLGIAQRVTFPGRIPEEEKHRIYRRAKVALVASEKEGWGLAAVEPQTFGCPVVAYDVPGVRDSVRNGETGILVPSGDVKALRRALCSLVEDEADWHRFARRASEAYLSHSWDEVFTDFYSVFQKVARRAETDRA
jgi:glycosyltransferase involved in cell wall biosynthesis